MRTRNRICTAIIIAFIILTPGSLWCWGRIAHQVTARMAEARLTPAALAAVHDLLGTGVSLADVAAWADEQQEEIPRSSAWHYVKVPITESRYVPKFCRSGGCIVSKIEDFKRVLRDPKASRLEKQQTLKFLIHLIADLHQPLHVGDTDSQGGNSIQVRFFSVGSNLHVVWDSQIIERHSKNRQVWLWELDGLAKPRMAAEWSRGTMEDWATETLQVAKEAYCLPGTKTVMKSGTKLGDPYCWFALPIIQKQLAKAGIRVAWILNGIFK